MSRPAGTYPHYLYVGDVFSREKLAGITGFCGKCPGAALSGPRSRERRPTASRSRPAFARHGAISWVKPAFESRYPTRRSELVVGGMSMATENCTLRGESCRAAGTFSR